MSSEVQPLIPSDPTAFGGWKLLGRLGKGGFSTIYLGEKNGQLSAIKMIRKELLGEAIVFERFATEIRNLEKLTHDGIAKLIDDDLSTEVPYIAMEYVQGETLEQYVLKNGSLPEPEWLKILESVTSTLEYCHSKGIVHKDIGPGNIMLGKDGPKLIDFGISYEQGSSRITQADQIVGTPSYMSPEHLSGQITEAMDVFSLGATFAFAGTGREPFASDSRSQTRTSITLEMPKLEGLSTLQRELIEPLLYKKTSDRPHLSELLTAIKSIAENGTIGNYTSYNRRRNKKLVSRKIDIGKQRRKRNIFRLAISIAALTAVIFGAYVVSTDDNLDTGTKLISENQSTTDAQNDSGDSGGSIPSSAAKNNPDLQVATSSSQDCENAYVNNKNSIEKSCLSPAQEGDVRSMFYLGRNASLNGRKVDAEKWFLLAAAKDDVYSMGELAQIYLDQKQTKKYKIWVTKCADFAVKNSAVARCKLLLGIDLLNANETNKAVLHLKDSAEYGNGSAAAILGMYYAGLQEKDTALSWYVKSAELGDSTGLDKLIRLAKQLGKTDLYMKWLKVSAENGNGEYAWLLAMEYFEKEDYKNAKKYAAIGANAGDKNAMGVLGIILYKIDKDLPNARIWLKRAADGDDVIAINLLGLIARVEDKDYQASINWYKKSAELGDLEAGYWLGALYAGGLNDGPNACISFKAVIARSDELKRLGTFAETTMNKWVSQAEDGIKQTC
jgi:serine/threonine protein kinase